MTQLIDHHASIIDVLRAQCEKAPDDLALIFYGPRGESSRQTYADLEHAVRRAATAIRAAGLPPGELVVLALDHEPSLVAAFFGALMVGAVPAIVPYPDPATSPEVYAAKIEHLARVAAASGIVAHPAIREALAEFATESGCRILTPGDFPSPEAFEAPHPAPDSPCYIQFTSGTTGVPRGIVLSIRAALAQVRGVRTNSQTRAGDVTVGWLPFFHDMGLVSQLLHPLLTGGTLVTIPPAAWVRRPWLLFEGISKYRGTVSQMPNFAFMHCLKTVEDRHLEGLRLDTLRGILNGAEPIQAEIMERFAERFAPWGFPHSALCVGYGMAEYYFVSSTRAGEGYDFETVSLKALQEERCARPVPPGDPGTIAVVNCGPPGPGAEVRILDEAGRALPERSVGDIVVRGPCLFSHYHRLPEETAAVLRDGWFHTGDVGYQAAGCLFVCDRKKDLIIIGGHNVLPNHIETVAGQVLGDALREAAAFGVPDPSLGTEAAVLAVVLRGKLDAEQERRLITEVRRRVREELTVNLADVCLVRSAWIVKTTSGKVSRRACRDKYLEEKAAAPPEESGPDVPASLAGLSPQAVCEALEKALAKSLALEAVPPDADLFSLGLTSLEAVRLILQWEKAAGHRIVVEDWVSAPTLANLARLLLAPPPAEVSRPGAHRQNRREKNPGQAVAKVLPYRLGCRLQRAWLSTGLLRGLAFSRPVAVLRAWTEIVGRQDRQKEYLLRNLMINTWIRWRLRSLEKPENAAQWLEVAGEEHLRSAQASQRGVVVVSQHYPLMKLFRWYLKSGRAGRPGVFFRPHRHRHASMETRRTLEVYAAQHRLLEGHAVWIMGDGLGGATQLNRPFFGRDRAFRPGPAELAVRTGAAMVPVFLSMDSQGRVRLEFTSPLEPPPGPEPKQVEALICAYADLLVQRWPDDLPDTKWKHLARYLEGPAETDPEDDD